MHSFFRKSPLHSLLILSSFLLGACNGGTTRCEKTSSQENTAHTVYADSLKNEILESIVSPAIPAQTISILTCGAVGDSLTDCKPAFDQAIRMAADNGGARIVVPEGTYFIKGPIHLASNVCLDLQAGSRLKFSEDTDDYLPAVLTSWEGTLVYNYSPLIYGYGLENVSITGKGTIDGNSANGFSTWRPKQKESQQLSRDMNHRDVPVEERMFGKGHFLRPQLIQLFECRNILLEDFFVTNSPFWCIHLLKSENITARGIRFNAKNINNDGIDPEYSRNILIENIAFDNGDDNIAIKAGRDHEGRKTARPSENIIIRNCSFKGLHAVVIGSEMSSGVQNVFVENCTYGGYCKRGIYLKSNPDRGGFIRNIFIDSVSFGEVEDLFFITSFYHNEGHGHATEIRDVYVKNVTCRKASQAGLVVQGYPEKKITDIYFQNIAIDSASIGVSFTNAENIVFSDVTIGGIIGAPSFAGAQH